MEQQIKENQLELNRLVAELTNANKELVVHILEKEVLTEKLTVANEELIKRNNEKENHVEERYNARKELIYQKKEKGKLAREKNDLEAFSVSQKIDSEYTRSLIEASHDPLFTISIKGKIMDVNHATVRVTGISKVELINSDFKKYFTDEAKARKGYREIFKKGFVNNFPLTIKDSTLTEVLCNGSILKNENGENIGALMVARDITIQKTTEKELIEAKIFAELATGISEAAKMKAEQAVKSKQQFLSNMSHEIRTPMNAIIGFTKVVLKTELTSKQKEYLLAIKMSGDALIVLINDILDLAKVDAGKMTFEEIPFQLGNSTSAMLHIFDTKVQEKNLQLNINYDESIPKVLIGDPVRLHQIILNLLSNAVKFTQEGSITVRVKKVYEDEKKVQVEFSIADTGIGIVKEKIQTIFENFQQATSNTSRLFGGTGLGLAIVKQLVEAQGGTIVVNSEINKGSIFSFTLGFLKTTEEAVVDVNLIEINAQIKDVNVLVVEDMALNQLLMKTLLDDFGFESDIVGNGKLAIEKLKNKKYDIILMDLQMPIMNGFEATEYIRNIMKLNIPIMALTADVTTVDITKCLKLGMNDYVSKPIDERVLYSKIITFLEQHSKEIEKSTSALKTKCTDLQYLYKRTKSNPTILAELISAYLEQTPPLINAMKTSWLNKDWKLLYATVHKLLPSISIMGINANFEIMAKKIQAFANSFQETDKIESMVEDLGNILTQSLEELQEELQRLNDSKK